jgi:hypothetical protein
MHVQKCGDWEFKGIALFKNPSKRAANYFEESLTRLFGKLVGFSQFNPSFRQERN